MVTLTLFSDFFKMEGLLLKSSQKYIVQATYQLLEFLKDLGNLKKNPKTAVLVYTVTGT